MNVDLSNGRGSFRSAVAPPFAMRRVTSGGRRRVHLRGLGDGTCQVPQPGVTMFYPACPVSSLVTQTPAAVYQAPTLAPVPSCAQGPTQDTAECQSQLMATQHLNQSAADAANRAVFVGDCESNWQENATRFAELGLPSPPNNCQSFSYGQTMPGTTGGDTSGWIPGTPAAVINSAPVAAAAPAPTAGILPVASPATSTAQLIKNSFTAPAGSPGGASGGGAVTPPAADYTGLYWIGGGVAAVLLFMAVQR